MILNITGTRATEEIITSFEVKDPSDAEFFKACKETWYFDEVPEYVDLQNRAEELIESLLEYRKKDSFSKVLLPDGPAWYVSHVVDALRVEDITACFISRFGEELGLVCEE